MDTNYKNYMEYANLLKMLAHPVRLCILRGLITKGECNVTYMQSCLGTPQSTLSQHLQKLRMAGVIEGRRNGLEIYYQVKNEKVIEVLQVLFPE